MRTLAITALLAAVALAGCFGGDDSPEEHEHGDHDHCDPMDVQNYTPEECDVMDHGDDHMDNETEEPSVPNMLPNATLTMTGPGGVLNGSSFIQPGDWIIFSAAGSVDPDGEVALVGLTVTDGNGTRTAQLMENGQFVDANFTFSHVGSINVTVRVLDDDGEGVIRVASAAVNDIKSHAFTFEAPAPSGSADACTRPGSPTVPPLVSNNVADKSSISVQTGTMWISAKVTSGDAEVAICSPSDEALSPAGEDVATNDDADLSQGGQYSIMVYAGARGSVTVETIVHYEPKPAA